MKKKKEFRCLPIKKKKPKKPWPIDKGTGLPSLKLVVCILDWDFPPLLSYFHVLFFSFSFFLLFTKKKKSSIVNTLRKQEKKSLLLQEADLKTTSRAGSSGSV